MVTDDGVGEVSVETHTGGESDGHIGEETHEEGGQGSNGSGGSDHVALNALLAEGIILIIVAPLVALQMGTVACASSLGNNGRVDGNNVGHGEEGGQAGADLDGKVRALSLFALIKGLVEMAE